MENDDEKIYYRKILNKYEHENHDVFLPISGIAQRDESGYFIYTNKERARQVILEKFDREYDEIIGKVELWLKLEKMTPIERLREMGRYIQEDNYEMVGKISEMILEDGRNER